MFVEIILPFPLQNTYTYAVPEYMQRSINVGCLVLVPFGKTKKYTGVVAYIHLISPQLDFEVKEVIAIEETHPVVRKQQLRFWEWIAQYYLCRMGEVCKAALPAGFKLEHAQSYKPKTETFVRLQPAYRETEQLHQQLHRAFDLTAKWKKQENLLMSFIEQSKLFTPGQEREVSKKELLDRVGADTALLKRLIDKGIFETYEKTVSRLEAYSREIVFANELNPLQQEAYRDIMLSFRTKDVCLLHGVTSSGKTEIYIRLIAETLKLNRQALLLLPEIALTTQITGRLKRVFGDKLGIYHSKFSSNEKVEIWNNLLNDDGYRVIIGVRSSIFLPFKDLGLIIVDEEHETGYKQQDPSPRYHARNAAIVLATMHGGKVLLGTATPSVESFYNAQIGKYGYVPLLQRFEQTALPEIIPVDVKELRRKKRMKSLCSPLLLEKMKEALDNGEQVILFQNRRGFAPVHRCSTCDWTPKCRDCDVSLTYHKSHSTLTCHYCGNTTPIPVRCPECGGVTFSDLGFGTEKVEEEMQSLFPDIPIARLDLDSVRRKTAFEQIISDFERGKTRILIGTQMVSKGLDFDRVSVVGILSADSMMNYPDFRAHERAFQLMSQVSGRAGRRKKQGTVILQTSCPEHPLIQSVIHHDYETMFRTQSEERQMFHYPPFFRILALTVKHRHENVCKSLAESYASLLREALGNRVLGPDKPAVGRIQTLHIRKIILKIEISASLQSIYRVLENAKMQMEQIHAIKYAIVQYDMDPM
jgi:primosomal protein N' (replication factor Y)